MDFSVPASTEALAAAIAALKQNGFDVVVTQTPEEAKVAALELIPEGAEVMTMNSETLRILGVSDELNQSGKWNSVRIQFASLDEQKERRQRMRLGAAPEYAVGSVHAVTQDGHLLVASNTGSQLPAYASGADHVIWVVGTQKIVTDTQEGMRRIYEHCLPLESERAKKAYGVAGSAVNQMLVMNTAKPGRATIIFLTQAIGF